MLSPFPTTVPVPANRRLLREQWLFARAASTESMVYPGSLTPPLLRAWNATGRQTSQRANLRECRRHVPFGRMRAVKIAKELNQQC